MIVHIIVKDYFWHYYFIDAYGYKTTVEGFKTHIDAKIHAENRFGNDIEILYNK